MILGLLDNDDDNFFPFKTIDHFFAFDNDKDNVFWWMNDDGNDIDDFGGSRRWVWLKIKKTSFRSRNKTATTITMIMMIMWAPWISIQKKSKFSGFKNWRFSLFSMDDNLVVEVHIVAYNHLQQHNDHHLHSHHRHNLHRVHNHRYYKKFFEKLN